MSDPRLRITDFGPGPDGYLTARVHIGGHVYHCDRKYGSWRRVAVVDGYEVARELPFFVAAALQSKLPSAERKRAADRSKPPTTQEPATV